MIKKVWITNDGNDLHALCIREKPGIPMHLSTQHFPPVEPVAGKKLNIDEAKKLGLVEPHHVIAYFSRSELGYIKDVIEEFLG